jgi:hypothetical protein
MWVLLTPQYVASVKYCWKLGANSIAIYWKQYILYTIMYHSRSIPRYPLRTIILSFVLIISTIVGAIEK